MLLSACLIVKNEELTLKKCLNSLVDIVDEIIVVDTGSTDTTVSIARSFGAEIYYYEWDNNFSNARNFSLEKAQSDFVLVIDADEYLDDSDKLQIRPFLEQTEADGVIVSLQNYTGTMSRIEPTVPVSVVRVFKSEYRFKGRIHEQIIDDILDNGKPIERLGVTIHHVGYLAEFVYSRGKIDRNLDLLNEESIEGSKEIFHNTNKMSEFVRMGDFDSCRSLAEETYSKINCKEPKNLSHMDARAYIFYMISLWETEHKDEAARIAREALKLFPNYVEIPYRYGAMLLELGNYVAALEQFKYCRKLGEPKENWLDTHEGLGSYLAAIRLAETWGRLGDDQQARDWYLTAIYENPRLFDILLPLLFLLRTHSSAEYLQKLEELLGDPLSYLHYAETCSILGHSLTEGTLQRVETVETDLGGTVSRIYAALEAAKGHAQQIKYLEQQSAAQAKLLLGISYLDRGEVNQSLDALQSAGTSGQDLLTVARQWESENLPTIRLMPYIRDILAVNADTLLSRLLATAEDKEDVWLTVKYSPLSHVLQSVDWAGNSVWECEQNSLKYFQQQEWDKASSWLERAMAFPPTVTKIIIECDLALVYENVPYVLSVLRQGLTFFPESKMLQFVVEKLGFDKEAILSGSSEQSEVRTMNPMEAYRRSVLTMPLNVQLAQLHDRGALLTTLIKEQAQEENVNTVRQYIEELQNIITFLRASLDTNLEIFSVTDQTYAYYYSLTVKWFLQPNSVLDDYEDAQEFWETWAETWRKVPMQRETR